MNKGCIKNEDQIVFKNMESRRVGNGIRELRQRSGLKREQFADKANIDVEYLSRLEKGYEAQVKGTTLQSILEIGAYRFKGNFTNEELINTFLAITPSNPPVKLI